MKRTVRILLFVMALLIGATTLLACGPGGTQHVYARWREL